MPFYFIALVIALADQALKYLVTSKLALGQSIKVLGHIVQLTYVRNTGAAFSLFVGFSSYLVVIGLAVVLAVIFFHHRLSKSNFIVHLGLACVLGGSLGNLIDRVARAYVVDYIDILIWPVFNLADIMINVGVILIAYQLFAEDKKDVSCTL
jgi:signal peptidase II